MQNVIITIIIYFKSIPRLFGLVKHNERKCMKRIIASVSLFFVFILCGCTKTEIVSAAPDKTYEFDGATAKEPIKATKDKINFARQQEENCKTNLAYQFAGMMSSVSANARTEDSVSAFKKIVDNYVLQASKYGDNYIYQKYAYPISPACACLMLSYSLGQTEEEIKQTENIAERMLFKEYYEHYLKETSNEAKFLNALKKQDFNKAGSILKNNPDVLNSTKIGGLTPLSIMVDMGNTNAVKFLINNNADVNKNDDNSSYCPMLYLLEGESVEIAKMLLEHGADINAVTSSGRNALYKAAIGGNTDLVKFLLDSGIEFNNSMEQTDRILSAVKDRGYNDILKLLNEKLEHNKEK